MLGVHFLMGRPVPTKAKTPKASLDGLLTSRRALPKLN